MNVSNIMQKRFSTNQHTKKYIQNSKQNLVESVQIFVDVIYLKNVLIVFLYQY